MLSRTDGTLFYAQHTALLGTNPCSKSLQLRMVDHKIMFEQLLPGNSASKLSLRQGASLDGFQQGTELRESAHEQVHAGDLASTTELAFFTFQLAPTGSDQSEKTAVQTPTWARLEWSTALTSFRSSSAWRRSSDIVFPGPHRNSDSKAPALPYTKCKECRVASCK